MDLSEGYGIDCTADYICLFCSCIRKKGLHFIFVKGKHRQSVVLDVYQNVDNVLLNDYGKRSLGIRRQTISYHTVDVSSLYLKGENSVNGAEK